MILHAANMCICIENEYISPAPKYKFEKKNENKYRKSVHNCLAHKLLKRTTPRIEIQKKNQNSKQTQNRNCPNQKKAKRQAKRRSLYQRVGKLSDKLNFVQI